MFPAQEVAPKKISSSLTILADLAAVAAHVELHGAESLALVYFPRIDFLPRTHSMELPSVRKALARTENNLFLVVGLVLGRNHQDQENTT